MSKNSTVYTFFFAFIVCMVCGILLSFVATSLRSLQQENIKMDKQKNILKVVGLWNEEMLPSEVETVFEENVKIIYLDEEGYQVEEQTEKIIYECRREGKVMGYCYPVIGKGLWSTLYGYFAIEPDAKTVKGITFYKHGETPGLGGEIEKSWFQNNFVGKKIWSDKKKVLRCVQVVKGKAEDIYTDAEECLFYVDGISGATMTCNGVNELLDRELRKYEPFLKKVR